MDGLTKERGNGEILDEGSEKDWGLHVSEKNLHEEVILKSEIDPFS